MQVTVPMRARKSKSRIAPTWYGRSFRRNKSSFKIAGQKRYVFSLLLFGLNIAALVIGGVAGTIENASARDNYRNYNSYNNDRRGNDRRGNNDNRNRNSDSRSERQTNQNNGGAVTTVNRQAPPSAPTQQQTTTPAQTTQQATPPAQAVVAPAQVVEEPEPVDSAPQVALTAAAQAEPTSDPITYTTQQISPEVRNRLIALAVSAAVSGAAIYFMSFFGNNLRPTRRSIPVRYVGQEVSLS